MCVRGPSCERQPLQYRSQEEATLHHINLTIHKGETVFITGPSGSGKSTSIRNLDPKSTFIINIAKKALPFKGFKKNYKPLIQGEDKKWTGNLYNTSDVDKIS